MEVTTATNTIKYNLFTFRSEVISKTLTLIVGFVGILVLVGWQFDIEFIKRPLPGSVAMNPLTAICFILCSLSLICRLYNRKPTSFLSYLFACIVLFCAILKLADLLLELTINFDIILFHNKLKKDVVADVSNSMAPNTALGFMLTAITLLLSNNQSKKGIYVVQYLALLIALLGILSVLGYLYQIPQFYGVLKYIPMALHTAIAFFLLAFSILLSNSTKGFMADFMTRFLSSNMAQRSIATAIIVPVSLGYFHIYFVRKGIISSELGMALLVISVLIIFLILIWYNTRELNRKEALRREVETDLETSLKEASYYKHALDRSAILAFTDTRGKLKLANDNFSQISKYDLTELMGQDYGMIDSRHHSKESMDELWTTITSGKIWKGELMNKAKDGTHYWLDMTIVPFWDMNSETQKQPFQYLAIGYDITDRKNAELKLKAAQTYLSSSIESFKDIFIFSLDKEFRYLFFNSAFKTATYAAYGTEVKAGMSLLDSITNEDDKIKAMQNCEKALAGEAHTKVEVYGTINVRSYETTYAPIVDHNGEIIGVTVLSADVTLKKQQEEKILTLNKELEAFSYSVSHDLRAPLRAINGYANIIKEDYADRFDEEGKKFLSSILFNSKRMGDLIDDLLAYSRLGRMSDRLTEINMTGLVKTVIEEVMTGNTQEVKFNISELFPAKGEFPLIKQVWVNVISNAVKYSKYKLRPEVTIGSKINEDGMVTYYIRDNGAGFDMEYYDKLFGVFHRLHSQEEFEGTGIGLAIVRKIVERHYGKVWADSILNQGACFYFTLPGINYIKPN